MTEQELFTTPFITLTEASELLRKGGLLSACKIEDTRVFRSWAILMRYQGEVFAVVDANSDPDYATRQVAVVMAGI